MGRSGEGRPSTRSSSRAQSVPLADRRRAMGRPPHGGGPVFRFTQAEVAEMEVCLRDVNNAMPSRQTIGALADKFSASAERAGKIAIQSKQVWNWFQNRRYAQRAKMIKANVKLNVSPTHREDSVPCRTVSNTLSVGPESSPLDTSQMEFEARSARDGAWYDVATFLSHRICDNGETEVKIRFTCFENDDEWVNILKCVRLRSLPCEPSECVVVLRGDLILCFQEGKDHALYFDAHVLDAQRRRHDVRGCRCRFLVRYDHDKSEEIVPLRKICRRPETDCRLQMLQTSKTVRSLDMQTEDASCVGSSKGMCVKVQKPSKLHTDEVIGPTQSFKEAVTVAIAPTEAKANSTTTVDFPLSDVVVVTGSSGNIHNDTSTKING